jgi:hypothetical protein
MGWQERHALDAQELLAALKKFSNHVPMLKTTSFCQIYLSPKNVEQICRLKMSKTWIIIYIFIVIFS